MGFRARATAVVGFIAAYALLSHWLMVHAANAALTVGLLFGPLIAAVAAAGWRQRQWATLAGCAVLGAVLVWVVLRGEFIDAQRLYVLQHAAIHLVLAWGFAITLRPGQTALITLLARGLHGQLRLPFTPALAAYTRRLTQGWVAFFVGMVIVSVLLYLAAPWTVWSFFCTMVTPLAAVVFFLGEHVWRRVLHPEFPRVSPRAAFEAYRQHAQRVPNEAPQ